MEQSRYRRKTPAQEIQAWRDEMTAKHGIITRCSRAYDDIITYCFLDGFSCDYRLPPGSQY